jgi:hypothetical protein
MDAPGVFADLAGQRACWHPVAYRKAMRDLGLAAAGPAGIPAG